MDRSFKGRAKRLDNIDLPKVGARIGVGEDEIHAFIDVETRGSGFDDHGRPRILFERHKFYKYLKPNRDKLDKAIRAGLANPKTGGYGKESEQYGKLLRAMDIDEHAALYACSWGLGQVMGFNHKLAGYDTVEAMVEAFKDDEENHLNAAVTFIINTGLANALKTHDWAAFAKGYNGSNYHINDYDTKLSEAFTKWSRIKDTPYNGIENFDIEMRNTLSGIAAQKLQGAPKPSPVQVPTPTTKPAPAPVSGGNKGKATAAGGIAVIVGSAIAYFWDKIEALIHSVF